MLPDLYTDFSRGMSSGLVFPSLYEFSTLCPGPHNQRRGIFNTAEVNIFLELSCFFDDPTDVGNLISSFNAFSKSSLNIWKFMIHVLLKPSLENVLFCFLIYFYWRIVVLQNFAVFCQTSTWISHRHTYIPSFLSIFKFFFFFKIYFLIEG